MTDQRTKKVGFWNTKPSNALQKTGIIASIVLSALAVLLTAKYGESQALIEKLSDEVKEQQHQSTIQQKQLEKTGSIVAANRTLIGNTVKLLHKTDSTNNQLGKQSVILSTQVKLLRLEYQDNDHIKYLAKISSAVELEVNAQLIKDLLVGREGKRRTRYDDSTRLQTYLMLHEYLARGLKNSFLFEHSELTEKWIQYYSQIGEWVEWETSTIPRRKTNNYIQFEQKEQIANFQNEKLHGTLLMLSVDSLTNREYPNTFH
jgi:hypothetical protein